MEPDRRVGGQIAAQTNVRGTDVLSTNELPSGSRTLGILRSVACNIGLSFLFDRSKPSQWTRGDPCVGNCLRYGNMSHPMRHAYRLVFLHSCSGSGKTLPGAFGIDRKHRVVAEYLKKGLKARVIIGAVEEAKTISNPSEIPHLRELFAVFYSQWMQNTPVNTCLSLAQTWPPPGGTRWPIAPEFVVRGATDLQKNGQ